MTQPLEFNDIQHILLTRTPALTGRYVFLKFGSPEAGRGWLREILGTVRSAADVDTSENKSSWVTVAFTWNGLKALGLDEEALATFPDEFKHGMAARAEVLGDTGPNAPEHWVDGTSRDDLHA
ncbi:MAG: peroxidase, partial [Myxococcales bacterium]